MTRQDFVEVQLSAAGKAAAGEGEAARVRVAGYDYEYIFVPGKSQSLTAAEFNSRLASITIGDEPIFEVAIQAQKPDAGSEK